MQRHNLSSNLVISFLTVLRMQSHTKAAQVLNLTQPAVSQHISKLEDLLDVKLIERSRGAIVPTKEARLLLPDFERLERSVEMMFDKARTAARKSPHSVRIGAPTSMVSFLLAPAVAAMQSENDKVFPVIREVDDFHVYDMMRSGEVDFALTSMTGNDAELTQTMLVKDRTCVVFPAGHELDQNGHAGLDLEEIFDFSFIRPSAGTAANRILEACEKSAGREFSYAAETSRLMTMEVLAGSGIGLLVLPGLSARMIARQNLKFRPLKIDAAHRTCNLIKSRRKRLSPVAQKLVDGIRKRAKVLASEFPQLVMT